MRLFRRRPRWQATTVGLHSGTIRSLPFVQFRREEDMRAWVEKMNAGSPLSGVGFGYEPIP